MENEQNEKGFCPACGEPVKDGKIDHDEMCPYAGDELGPEEANGAK